MLYLILISTTLGLPLRQHELPIEKESANAMNKGLELVFKLEVEIIHCMAYFSYKQ